MKRILALALALIMMFCAVALTSCTEPKNDVDANKHISTAVNIAALSGRKIAAQSGTYHAKALKQITNVKSSEYPEFSDLLSALKSGAIEGYIAEEPTALSVCLEDSTLDYLHLKNNDTGFTATDADIGIAVGLKTDSELVAKINPIIEAIPVATRMALMEEMVKLKAGQSITEFSLKSEAPATVNGTLKVAMECAYAPFNWTDIQGKTSTGAVAVSGEGKSGQYANGYDVQIAQYIANKLGMKLEIYSYEWDSLIPALESGAVDAIVAGMSPTAEREEQIDFTKVYYESNLVVIYKKQG